MCTLLRSRDFPIGPQHVKGLGISCNAPAQSISIHFIFSWMNYWRKYVKCFCTHQKMCLSHFHHVSFYLFFCKIIENRQHYPCNHRRPKSCACSLSGWKLRTPSPLLGCAGHGQGQYHQHQHFSQGPDHHHYHDYFDHQIKSTIK